MIVERSIYIERPPADVFEHVADTRNDPTWHTDVLEAEKTPAEAPIGVGTSFHVKLKPSMGISEGTMKVAEFDPPSRVVLHGNVGKATPIVTHLFTAEGNGTRFTRRIDMTPPGLLRLMSPMIKSMIGKANSGFVANLKRVLEEKR